MPESLAAKRRRLEERLKAAIDNYMAVCEVLLISACLHRSYSSFPPGYRTCVVYAKNCTSLDFYALTKYWPNFVKRGIDENRGSLHELLSTEHGYYNDDNDDPKSTTLSHAYISSQMI